MDDGTSFDPSSICLQHCYTYCWDDADIDDNQNHDHKPHKYKLYDLIADEEQKDHDLARKICEHLLSDEDHRGKCEEYVHSL